MNRTFALGLGLVGALGIGTALAQPGGRGPAGHEGLGPHGPGPVVQALDADQDGTISADEIAGAPEVLITLDSDGDGALTREDLRPPRPAQRHGKGRGHRGRPGNHQKPMLDADSNGTVSLEEFLTPAQAHFPELDADGNGTISLEEFLAKPTEDFNELDTDGDGEIDAPMDRAKARRPGRHSRANRRSNTR